MRGREEGQLPQREDQILSPGQRGSRVEDCRGGPPGDSGTGRRCQASPGAGPGGSGSAGIPTCPTLLSRLMENSLLPPHFGEARFSPSKGPHPSSLQIGMVPSDSAVFFQTLQGAYPNWSQKRMGKDLISSGLLLHLNRKGRASQAFLTTPNTLRDLVLALHPLFSNSPLSPESQDSGWPPPTIP